MDKLTNGSIFIWLCLMYCSKLYDVIAFTISLLNNYVLVGKNMVALLNFQTDLFIQICLF